MKKKTPDILKTTYYGFEVFVQVKPKGKRPTWQLYKHFNTSRYRWYTDVLRKVELYPKKVSLLLGNDIEQEAIEFSYNRKRYMVVHYKL